ncbi:RNA polymerase sigma factor [Microbacterium sp. NPDC055683]
MGRREVFSVLFDQFYGPVVRYVERRVHNTAIAEELAAETFEIAWRRLAPDSPPGLPWLYRTAANQILNHRRRLDTTRNVEVALASGGERDDRLDDERMDVVRAIRSLPDREREAIALTYWEGLAPHEVAEVLGCRVDAVWKALSRGRARLRRLLSDGEVAARAR